MVECGRAACSELRRLARVRITELAEEIVPARDKDTDWPSSSSSDRGPVKTPVGFGLDCGARRSFKTWTCIYSLG